MTSVSKSRTDNPLPALAHRQQRKILSGGRAIKSTAPRDSVRVEKFVYHLCSGMTQTDAAIAAGFSARSARSTASHLLENSYVQAMVKERMDALAQELRESSVMSLQETLTGVSNIARSNLQNLFDDELNFIHIKRLPKEVAECISSFEIIQRKSPTTGETEQVFKIKQWDKLAAKRLLMQYYGALDGEKSAQALPEQTPVDIDPETLTPEQRLAIYEAIKNCEIVEDPDEAEI